MDEVNNLTNQLAVAIENSSCRKKYLEAKEKIIINQSLVSKIKEYKRAHMEFQLKLMNNSNPSFEEERIVSKLYSDLMLNDEAKTYLECEKDLMGVITDVQNVVCQKIGLNSDF